MASTSNATATATSKKRQSCDRCHGQKLRCIRTGSSDTEPCNRCLRQGAQCVYSSSLPKGRPNMYRLADASTAPSNPPAVTSVTAELPRQHPTNLSTTAADPNANDNANSDVKMNANMNGDATLSQPMDTFTHTSTWPWLEPPNWNDVQMDGSEHNSGQWTSDLPHIVDPSIEAGAAFFDGFPSLRSWTSTGSGEGDASARGVPPSSTPLYAHGLDLGVDPFESSSSNSNSNSNSSDGNMVIDKNGPDDGIARLSQLSTRLYPLHRSSCNLADTAEASAQGKDGNPARQSPLIDDAAFKSVAAWLVHASANMNLLFRTDGRIPGLGTSTTGDTLHDAFSASHHLLEILRCLQVDESSGTSTPSANVSKSMSTSTGEAQRDFWASITQQSAQSTLTSEEITAYFEQRNGSSSSVRSPGQYSNTVVRHLVKACDTLLLNVYVAVLVALQHDADRWNSSRPVSNSDVHADSDMDAAVLTDIRLVLAVQLCSYLIERQHQAVDTYLAPESPPMSLQQYDPPGSGQASPPASTSSNGEKSSDLKTEVQHRLTRLRQTLRI